MTKYEKEQEKLKRWYEKDFYWVYKRTCSVCGADFYTHNKDDTVCHHGEFKANRKKKTKQILEKASMNIDEIKKHICLAITEKTKDMSREEKDQFRYNVMIPVLNGNNAWQHCQDPELLLKLLNAVKSARV